MTTQNSFTSSTLDQPFDVTTDQARQFQEQGFIKLKDVLDAETLAFYGDEVTTQTFAHNPAKDQSLEEKDTYGKAFIQVGQLWRHSEIVRQFMQSRRMAQIATDLLGSTGVRLYHDQALYKEPAGGFTPWHVDQQYWPMESAKSVTAWIPLQATPIEMGPLCFGKGSHLRHIGRDLEISDESERLIREEIKKQKIVEVFEPYELGEISYHYGWTLHRAGGNTTDQPRKVYTIIYMDHEMVLADPKNKNQQRDWKSYSPSTEVGLVMDDELNPVLYSKA